MNPDKKNTKPNHKTNLRAKAYREDPDLEFLQNCSRSTLNSLGCILLQSKNFRDDQAEVTDSTTQRALSWKELAGEIQRLGANPLARAIRRGRGAYYIKILENICKLFSVEYIPDSSAEVMERKLCLELFSRSLRSLTEKHLPILCNAFGFLPENLTINTITLRIVDAMRLDDKPNYLLNMCMGHGAAVHVGCPGYERFAPEKYCEILALLERPVSAELNTMPSASRTGLQYGLLIPAVLQISYLRAAQNAKQT
jgi:uncharacterized protein YaaW (UPF0174 family)